MTREDSAHDRSKNNPTSQLNKTDEFYPKQQEGDPKFWAILLFGLIGATVTTAAITHSWKSVEWIYSQTTRSTSSRNGSTGRSSRTSYQEEEAWRRYNRRLQEEIEKEFERVERLRRMQSALNRERNKYKWSYESWSENSSGGYHQHFQWSDDWYWKSESPFGDQGTYFRERPRAARNYGLSHHYSVLGLDRWRKKPYTDDEVKSAFRVKAKEFHPDQNQGNKEVAEAKFKEIMASYEAVKSERKDNKKSL